MKTDPRIYLAVDNCFASKRWTRPGDWMDVIRDLGLCHVEASADTELDPLYMGGGYIADWIREVERQSERTGVRVHNLYSGHGTYATLGLAHDDGRVRRRFLRQWMETQADTAKALGAGFGFFAHAFDDYILQDAGLYAEKTDQLRGILAELAAYCKGIGLSYVGIEQMYSPHQPPWTVAGTLEMIRDIFSRGGAPMYITNDVGHMNGQQYFQRPDEAYIRRRIAMRREGRPDKRAWMGSARAMAWYKDAAAGRMDEDEAVARILEDARANPHLFASPEDCRIETWIERAGRYSPIVHLQQTDGKSSPHWPFDEDHNRAGIVTGEGIMRSLVRAFEGGDAPGMPPACEEVVLTLEPFIGTAGNNYTALEEIGQSVDYWRRFIPRDGMRLSEAAALIHDS